VAGVALPAGAALASISDGAPGREMIISYGNSWIILAEDGSITEQHIEPQDEEALAPLLEALESSGPPPDLTPAPPEWTRPPEEPQDEAAPRPIRDVLGSPGVR
jgi:hypothetical protein